MAHFGVLQNQDMYQKLGNNPELALKKAIERAVIIIENRIEDKPMYIDNKR